MFRDVIFLSALILVLFIIWIALKLNIRVRKSRAEQIKKVNFASYVTFANNFTRGEEAEMRGDREGALRHVRRAMSSLNEEEDPDELTRQAIDDVRKKIATLEK